MIKILSNERSEDVQISIPAINLEITSNSEWILSTRYFSNWNNKTEVLKMYLSTLLQRLVIADEGAKVFFPYDYDYQCLSIICFDIISDSSIVISDGFIESNFWNIDLNSLETNEEFLELYTEGIIYGEVHKNEFCKELAEDILNISRNDHRL